MVKIDETDPGFSGYKRYYFSDNDGNLMRITVVNEKGDKFVFRNLPFDPNGIPELDVEDDVSIAGNLLFGENPSAPIANKKIILKDDKGIVMDETTTNAFGAFVFSKIPNNIAYTIELADKSVSLPPNTKIILTNKSGKELKEMKVDGNGKFKFSLLEGDKNKLNELIVTDDELLLNFIAKLLDEYKKPIASTNIFLTDEQGNKRGSAVTDSEGKFEFKKLFGDMGYYITVDENDPKLKGFKKIYITDLLGNVIKELIRKNNKFNYHILKVQQNELSELFVDDPWLEVLDLKNKESGKEITITENVFYALGDYKFDDAGRLVLDKVIKIMKDNPAISIELSSHTDSRAKDDFNLKLSQKRAKVAVDYMISRGIDKKKLLAVGYGETKLKNNCGNDVNCSEEEHAQNRRTEFKIISSQK
jgi:outer membrane protein OmpA-like peptidoglycan-associated protein